MRVHRENVKWTHYRFDIDAGQEIGRRVAEKTLERAFVPRTH